VAELSLAEVQDELYSLAPGEFIAVRDERARQAREAGQRDLAAEIKKLGRPTASAWLVNQLTRDRPEQMSRLFEVGEELHEAQRTLAGDRLRELSADRRRAVAELLPEASKLAAHARQSASATVLGEVKATLEAALADPEARAAVRSGRLTKALMYAGLGEVDLTAALAAVPEPDAAEPGQAGRRSGARTGRRADRATGGAGGEADDADGAARGARRAATDPARSAADAERAVKIAERESSAATAAVEKADRKAASLAEQRQFLRRRLDHLERELREARAEDARLERDIQRARDAAEQARASAGAASRALESARKRLALSQRRGAER
jgi:hypothetical protein